MLDDPRKCKFDPAVLTCQAGSGPGDLLHAEASAGDQEHLERRTHAERASSSIRRSCQAAKPERAAGQRGPRAPLRSPACTFSRPTASSVTWCSKTRRTTSCTFNFGSDLDFALAKVGPALDAIDPDLRDLNRRKAQADRLSRLERPRHLAAQHGQLLRERRVVHGASIAMTARLRLQRTNDFFRLFMVPGMQHCSGGPGPSNFDMLTALENWVENGVAPTRVIASHITNGTVDRTRPLCVYPRVAVYTGAGSTNDAANFQCALPPEEE